MLHLITIIYLTVSGGTYGIEEAVRAGGGRLVLLLCLVVPLLLSLPSALMAAELTALIPTEGGFYFWTKAAFGAFAGFAETYFTLIYAFLDMALYPVLFGAYFSHILLLPPGTGLYVGIIFIWAAGLLNYLGARPTGNVSVLLMILLLAPLAVLVAIGSPGLISFRLPPPSHYPDGLPAALAGSLIVVIWNFCGWENAAVLGDELEMPRRNYIRALQVTLPLVVLGYLLPVAVAAGQTGDPSQWSVGYLAEAGRLLGGPGLGWALALGGAVSAFAIFEAGILWISRLPLVLARQGYLPRVLARVSATRSTPPYAILACCVIFTILMPLGFTTLVVLDVFFYMAALALELLALVRLRTLAPIRPPELFTIAGGRTALLLIVAVPILTWLGTFGLVLQCRGGKGEMAIALSLALGVIPVYLVCRSLFGGAPQSGAGGL